MTRVLSIAGAVACVMLTLSGCRGPGAQDASEAVDQPIAFYHNVHAGDNQIACMYCHYTADRSPDAGIPSVQLCVGCHVPGSSITTPEQAQLAFPQRDRPAQGDTLWNVEATKLVNAWRNQEPIPWVRIHKLPEHVRFPHMSHVQVGLQCQTCHGPVEEMEKVYQFSSLQMGWCIDCHRGEQELSDAERQSVRQRSTFVQQIAQLRQAGGDARVAGWERTYPEQIASTDCVVCHY